MYDFLNIKHSLVLICLIVIEDMILSPSKSAINTRCMSNWAQTEPSDFIAQSSYGKPLSRVAARLGAPSGAYGSLAGAAAASAGLLLIIMETVTL